MENTKNSNDNANVVMVDIDDIIIPKRHRSLNQEKAEMLQASIEEVGLLAPIVVTEDYALVAGRHRLAAFQALGKEKIPAVVMTFSDIDAELAEIDENLIRYELEVMDRALHISRRKKLYELKYPHTKEQHLKDKMSALLETGAVEDASEADKLENELSRPSFVKDTAAKTGRSSTVIRDEANLGEQLEEKLSEEVIELLRPTKAADNKRELLRLIDENDEEVQLAIAQKIRDAHDNGKSLSVNDALNEIHGVTSHTTSADTTGEKPILANISKAEKILVSVVTSSDFARIAAMWTEEGQMDMRDQLIGIRTAADSAINTLSKLIDGE